MHWHKTKNRNWNREKVERGETEINYQYQPSPLNLGNYYMSGLGRYGLGDSGRTPNILEFIDDLTEGKPKLEQALGQLLLEFSRSGIPITDDDLYNKGFLLYEDSKKRACTIAYLNRFAYNLCIKEISRRNNQSFPVANEVPEYPFGIAIAKTLCLLADGHLRMDDVFYEDADYAVFAGSGVMDTPNLNKTKSKFYKVFFLYNKIYGDTVVKESDYSYVCEEAAQEFLKKYPNGRVVESPERQHRTLLKTYGGESESSGDEYEFSHGHSTTDEEIDDTPTSTPSKFRV